MFLLLDLREHEDDERYLAYKNRVFPKNWDDRARTYHGFSYKEKCITAIPTWVGIEVPRFIKVYCMF